MRMRAVVLLLFVLLAATLLVSCRSNENPPGGMAAKKTVKLGFPGTFSVFQGLLGVAQEKKFIEEELEKIGYKIEFVSFSGFGPAVNEALAGSKIDMAIYADFPGIIAKSRGVDIDLLGIPENKNHASVVVGNNSTITSVKGLKGKKIGFTKGTFVQKYFLQLLADNGMSAADVELIDLNSDLQAALVAGNVDALILIRTQALQLTVVQKIAKEIDNSIRTPSNSSQFVFVGSHTFVKNNPAVPVAINRGLLRAKNYFRKNQEECFQIITKSGMELAVAKETFQKEAPGYDLFTVGITQDSLKRLDETQKFMRENGLIDKTFDSAKWADNSSYLKARNE